MHKLTNSPTAMFPVKKYEHIYKNIQNNLKNINGYDLSMFCVSPFATINELCMSHDYDYVTGFINGKLELKEMKRIGFPWSQQLVDRVLGSVGGTLAAMHDVCSYNALQCTNINSKLHVHFEHKNSVSCHVGGGTHHAFSGHGEGFCVFNDVVVAADIALKQYSKSIRNILIIDLDVHQGNGTAHMCQKKDIFTFSMHCKGNHFSTIQNSNIDIDMSNGVQDGEYLEQLQKWLRWLFPYVQPDLVFYQAGVDIHEQDRLGKLKITKEGVDNRNRMVYDAIKTYNMSIVQQIATSPSHANLDKTRYCRLVVTMGGGYPRNIDEKSLEFLNVVQMHSNVYVDAFKTFCM